MTVDLARIVGPAAGVVGQYDPADCWADRRNCDGRLIGKCVVRGEAGLLGLCSTHYFEIVGIPA
jgi:hypothetical protein